MIVQVNKPAPEVTRAQKGEIKMKKITRRILLNRFDAETIDQYAFVGKGCIFWAIAIMFVTAVAMLPVMGSPKYDPLPLFESVLLAVADIVLLVTIGNLTVATRNIYHSDARWAERETAGNLGWISLMMFLVVSTSAGFFLGEAIRVVFS